MAEQGRPSTVRNHPQRARIDSMLDDGVSYSTIVRTVHGLSLSSIGRYALSRKSDLAKLADGEPNLTTVVGRLLEAADDARDMRRQARLTAAPVGRSRAIKTEADILVKLINQLSIDDMAIAEFLTQVEALIPVLAKFASTHPDSARPLADELSADPATADLGAALMTRIET